MRKLIDFAFGPLACFILGALIYHIVASTQFTMPTICQQQCVSQSGR